VAIVGTISASELIGRRGVDPISPYVGMTVLISVKDIPRYNSDWSYVGYFPGGALLLDADRILVCEDQSIEIR
jgi:hypothetical protein